jgi:hypothetical protein
MNLKKIEKILTGKFVGSGASSYVKRIYRAAVSQRLRKTVLGRYTTLNDIHLPVFWIIVANYLPVDPEDTILP